MNVLRSAAGLFDAGRIDRIVIEITPSRWHVQNVSLDDGFGELNARLGDWHCAWACTGRAVSWPDLHGRFRARLRNHPHALSLGVNCLPPWNPAIGAVDVYCVRPGVSRLFEM